MTYLTRKNLIITPAILITAACATLLIQMKTANADEIEMNGRLEIAQCSTEYTQPAVTTCVSESWICRITDGEISCQTKR